MTPDLQIAAYVSKEGKTLNDKKNMLGVDINSKCFAISILSSEGGVLKQAYLGRDIWHRRKRIFERKSLLQSYADLGSHPASKKLEATKGRERNFVRNRIGEVIRDITKLALKYDADVAIEKLRRFGARGRRFNSKVMRIPFRAFRTNLESRCFDSGITLNLVDGWRTSKWCSRCGAIGRGHDAANYSLFRCPSCGLIVNSDRKASLAIAAKSLLERSTNTLHAIQISGRRVPVDALLRRPDEVGNGAVPTKPIDGKLVGFNPEQSTRRSPPF